MQAKLKESHEQVTRDNNIITHSISYNSILLYITQQYAGEIERESRTSDTGQQTVVYSLQGSLQ